MSFEDAYKRMQKVNEELPPARDAEREADRSGSDVLYFLSATDKNKSVATKSEVGPYQEFHEACIAAKDIFHRLRPHYGYNTPNAFDDVNVEVVVKQDDEVVYRLVAADLRGEGEYDASGEEVLR